MFSVGFEPTISVGERPQTHAFDGEASGTGTYNGTLLYLFTSTRIYGLLNVALGS